MPNAIKQGLEALMSAQHSAAEAMYRGAGGPRRRPPEPGSAGRGPVRAGRRQRRRHRRGSGGRREIGWTSTSSSASREARRLPEVKKAYRRLARQFHPGRESGRRPGGDPLPRDCRGVRHPERSRSTPAVRPGGLRTASSWCRIHRASRGSTSRPPSTRISSPRSAICSRRSSAARRAARWLPSAARTCTPRCR